MTKNKAKPTLCPFVFSQEKRKTTNIIDENYMKTFGLYHICFDDNFSMFNYVQR